MSDEVRRAAPRSSDRPRLDYVCSYCQKHVAGWTPGEPYVAHECAEKAAILAEAISQGRKEYEDRLRNPSWKDFKLSLEQCRLPLRTPFGLDALEVTPENNAAINIAKAVLSEYQEGKWWKSLYVHGPLGTGKTALVSALGIDLYRKTGRHSFSPTVAGMLQDPVEYATWGPRCAPKFWCVPEWFSAIHRKWDEGGGPNPYEAEKCDVLIWDDLGKQHDTSWRAAELFRVVNARYNAYRPIFYTSNFSVNDLATRMVEALGAESVSDVTAMADRIRETCIIIEMSGKSWRREGAAKLKAKAAEMAKGVAG